jgi:hypothetical protein
MEDLMIRMLEYLKINKHFDIIDQTELDQFSWDEANEICGEIESEGTIISDEADENGFESVIIQLDYKDYKIQLETVYGIGSFSVVTLL